MRTRSPESRFPGSASAWRYRQPSTPTRRGSGREQRRVFWGTPGNADGKRGLRRSNPRRDHQRHLRDQLEHAASPTLARAARDSAVTGIDAATTAHSQFLRETVRHAFVSGMSQALWVSAALMAVGALLAIAIRPRANAVPLFVEPEESTHEIAA